MRKFLSLTLALVMVLGTFSGVFAATESQNEAADFLAKQKILVGDEKGNLLLNSNLERRDAVILLSRLMGAEKDAKAFPTSNVSPSWTDVRTDAYYVPFFAWAESNKYFEGNDNKTFLPREDLKTQEYALVLLRALEYDVKGYDSWKEALENAKKVGVLEGLELKFDDKVVRGDMAKMTLNALKLPLNGKTQTLAEKLGIELPGAKELKVEKVSSENLREVKVELSNAKLANEARLADSNNYTVKGQRVDKVTVKDNSVIVLLKESLVKGRGYTLTIRNVDKEVNGDYSFTANDNTIPKIEKVEVLGKYGIKVTASEPIKQAKEGDFVLDGRNEPMNVETYGRSVILTPYRGTFASNIKELTVTGLEDFSGYRSASERFELSMVTDNDAPKVTGVTYRGNELTVTFDKDIYKDSVKAYDNRTSTGNVVYSSGRTNQYAQTATKVDTNKARYTFNDEIERNANVTIEGVQNHSGINMVRTTERAVEVLENREPEIIDRKVETNNKDKATITLTFDKNVQGEMEGNSKTEFDVSRHFVLYDGEVRKANIVEGKVVSAKYDVDRNGNVVKDKVVVELEGLSIYDSDNKEGFDYVLEVEGFSDTSTLRTKMYRDYVEFRITDKTAFGVTGVDVNRNARDEETEIAIHFNKAVDKEEALDRRNYEFVKPNGNRDNLEDLYGKVQFINKDKTIILVLKDVDFDVRDYDSLVVNRRIKSSGGDLLGANYVHNFRGTTPTPGEANKTALNAEVGRLEGLLVNADKYTAESVAAVRAELDKAKAVVANKDATQAQVDKALADLKAVELKEKAPVDTTIKATATRGRTTLGVTQYVVELEGANLEDITDVLVNGNSKKATSDLTGGVFSFRSGEIADTIDVVVKGETVRATIK